MNIEPRYPTPERQAAAEVRTIKFRNCRLTSGFF
jgi:hypothetical protein